METDELRYHQCERDESWIEHDGRGYELARVCEICKSAKMKGYRREILQPYSEADVDEACEPEDYY